MNISVKFYRFYIQPVGLFIGILLLAWGCANPIPLDGGEDDKIPPKLVSSVPDTFSTKYYAKTVELEFDEYLVLKNPNIELIVTPPMRIPPEIKLKNKTVVVTFQENLLPNTTYALNFGNAITDNNNGNIAKNYTFVFSTGDVIDSLSLENSVVDAFTLKPVENARILLYKDADSFRDTLLPYTVTTTDKSGDGTVSYLKKEPFYAFALLDLNNNYKYDLPQEKIAFADSVFTPGDSIKHRFLLFSENKPASRLKQFRNPFSGMVFFKFNGNAESVKIKSNFENEEALSLHTEWGGPEKDSLVLWYNEIADSIQYTFSFSDGTDSVIQLFPKKNINAGGSSGSNRKGKSSSAAWEIKSTNEGGIPYFGYAEFISSRVLDSADIGKISLKLDSTDIPFEFAFTDTVHRRFCVKFTQTPGYTYAFAWKDSTFYNRYEGYYKAANYSLKITQPQDYITLNFVLQNFKGKGQAILQLLNKDDKVLQEKMANSGDTLQFANLITGDYRIKLLYDDNRNGKWDSGSLGLKQQPEKVSYFPQNITVKPGFDLEYIWDLSQSGAGRKF